MTGWGGVPFEDNLAFVWVASLGWQTIFCTFMFSEEIVVT